MHALWDEVPVCVKYLHYSCLCDSLSSALLRADYVVIYLLIMLKVKRYLHTNGSSFQFLIDEDKAIHDGTEFNSSGVLVKAHKGRDASIVAAWKWLKIHLPKDVVTQEFIEGTGWLRSELYGI